MNWWYLIPAVLICLAAYQLWRIGRGKAPL